ncbi:MAG TPA: sigma 54-interacting transcriptional regulator [Candidatus Eisenbacteria bacterium]|nr:sigma 54-interacting transcriptional regulator [Candidatus Eisenbacteria bacterium]
MPVENQPHCTRSNVLVLLGTSAKREGVARSIHSSRPRPKGAYHQFDCRREADVLRLALCQWANRDHRLGQSEAFLDDRACTLFVNSVDALSNEDQELLLRLVDRLAETSLIGAACPLGLLITGSATDLEAQVSAGRFLPQLYDSLDKVRVVLSESNIQEELAEWPA